MGLETRCIRIKLKKDSLSKVQDWKDVILSHKEDAFKTLEHEGVYLEAVFLEQIGDIHYLIYVMVAEDFEKVKQVAGESTSYIEIFHKNFKNECWEDGSRLEPLIQLYSSSAICGC